MAVIFPKNERVKRSLDGNYRLLIYGTTGVGKTFFSQKFENPLLLSTDGNWRFTDLPYLEIIKWKATNQDLRNAKLKPKDEKDLETIKSIEDAQAQINGSFENVVDSLVASNGGGFATIIVDLAEDVYKFGVEETIRELGINNLSDLPYGQAFVAARDKFYKTYKKLIALPVNVVMLSHEKAIEVKDRLGRVSTYYQPKLDDHTLDLLSGSGFSLRAYWESNTSEKNVKIMQRMLSMGSTPDWFGVTRFALPVDQTESIPLDFKAFEDYMKYHNAESEVKPRGVVETPISLKKQNTTLVTKSNKPKEKPVVVKEKEVVEPKVDAPAQEEPVDKVAALMQKMKNKKAALESETTTPKPEVKVETKKVVKEAPAPEVDEDSTEEPEQVNISDDRKKKIADILANYNSFVKK